MKSSVDVDKLFKKLRAKFPKQSQGTKAWCRGHSMMCKMKPEYSLKECRIGAMMYEQGFMNGLRAQRKRIKHIMTHNSDPITGFFGF